MNRTQSLTVFLILTGIAQAAVSMENTENLHISHCLQGCPKGAPVESEIVVRHLYAVSINAETRLADWVSYRILPDTIGIASLLPRDWEDDKLAQFSLRSEELSGEGNTLVQPSLTNQQDSVYRITEFSVNAGDRGRLVPMTSFAGTSYWEDLNLLSIMAPMKGDLRLESWSRLDQAVNSLVPQEGELFVMSGPVYRFNSGQSDVEADNLPAAFYKVIGNQQGEVAAFVFDQDLPVHADYCQQATSLDAVETLTGLDLFPDSPEWPLGSLSSRLGC